MANETNYAAESLVATRDRFLALGNSYLELADTMLSAHITEWNTTFARIWSQHIHDAERYLTQAAVLTDLIEEGRVFS